MFPWICVTTHINLFIRFSYWLCMWKFQNLDLSRKPKLIYEGIVPLFTNVLRLVSGLSKCDLCSCLIKWFVCLVGMFMRLFLCDMKYHHVFCLSSIIEIGDTLWICVHCPVIPDGKQMMITSWCLGHLCNECMYLMSVCFWLFLDSLILRCFDFVVDNARSCHEAVWLVSTGDSMMPGWVL